jgi:hypothetical protein
MVHFNQLVISPDGKHLIIDVSVRGESYYDNVYLDSIIIDNQDTYVGTGPSSDPVFEYTVPDITSNITGNSTPQKHIRLDLTNTAITSLKGLFFVYVRVKGTPAVDTPCGMDNITTMSTVTNIYNFYQQSMSYIKELANNCTMPKNFANYFLKLKGLELAIKTGNYAEAINLYKRFFEGKENLVIGKEGCGCGAT